MLQIPETALVIVDIQGKLARIVQDSDETIANAGKLVSGAKVLGVPVIWTEQNPRGLGKTVEELAPFMDGDAIAKKAFSCWGEPTFADAVKELGRPQILLAGIETHICVYQTARDLLSGGYEVHLVTDAVSSRTIANRKLGIRKMRDTGASITSVETALFELLEVAQGDRFKQILRIVK